MDKLLNLDHMTRKKKVTCPFAKSPNGSGKWGQRVVRRINWHLNIIKPCFPPAWCLAAGTNICRAELWMGRQRPLLSTPSASCFPGPDEEVNTAPAYCKLLTGLVSFSFRFIRSRLLIIVLFLLLLFLLLHFLLFLSAIPLYLAGHSRFAAVLPGWNRWGRARWVWQCNIFVEKQ